MWHYIRLIKFQINAIKSSIQHDIPMQGIHHNGFKFLSIMIVSMIANFSQLEWKKKNLGNKQRNQLLSFQVCVNYMWFWLKIPLEPLTEEREKLHRWKREDLSCITVWKRNTDQNHKVWRGIKASAQQMKPSTSGRKYLQII